MQTHGGQAAADAIESSEREFSPRLLVDWDRDGQYAHPLSDLSEFVSSVKVSRSLEGALPEEVAISEGASAAELKATLGGEFDGMGMVQVFSAYNGASPFYLRDLEGCEVRYTIVAHTAAGDVEYPQFVGLVRKTRPNRGNGTVMLSALDRVELLRQPVQFAPWALTEYHTARGVVEPMLHNSQSIIDHCLRTADVSPTPIRPKSRAEMGLPPSGTPDGTVFWLSGTGSWDPLIGWHARTRYDVYPNVASADDLYDQLGPPHPLVADDPGPRPMNVRSYQTDADALRAAGYWVSNRDNVNGVGTHYVGLTLVLHPDGTNAGHVYTMPERVLMKVEVGWNCTVRIRAASGQVWMTMQNNNTGNFIGTTKVNLPTDADTVDIRAYYHVGSYDGTATDKYYFRVGNVLYDNQDAGSTGDLSGSFNETEGLVSINTDVAFCDMFYTFRNTDAIYLGEGEFSGEPEYATHAAVLDKGLQWLSSIPVRKGEDAWEIVKEVAAAEFGAVFWDESGVFRFWNADRIRAMQNTVARTLTLDEVSGLEATRSLDSVRNIWSIEQHKATTAYGVIYEAKDADEFYTPALTEREWRLWVDNVAAPNPFEPARRSTVSTDYPGWNDNDLHCYVVQWLVNGSWLQQDNRTGGLRINAFYTETGELIVRIWNGYEDPARLARGSNNTPSLRIGGELVQRFPAQVTTLRDQASIDKYGARNLKLSGDWVQDRITDSPLIPHLTGRTVDPIPATNAITIAGDPRLQMGDTLEIRDPGGFGGRLRVQVLGIERELSTQRGLRDRLTVQLIRPPGRWLLGHPEYSRLGRSTVLTGGSS